MCWPFNELMTEQNKKNIFWRFLIEIDQILSVIDK